MPVLSGKVQHSLLVTPSERMELNNSTTMCKTMNPDDKASNIGIRLVYGMASEINYQHILGLNVLTIRI